MYLILVACIRCAGVYDYLVDLAKASKILWFFQNLWIGQSRRQTNHKDEIPLHHSDIGQVLSVFRDTLFLGKVFLSLLSLDLCQFFGGKRLEVCRVLGIGRSTSGT